VQPFILSIFWLLFSFALLFNSLFITVFFWRPGGRTVMVHKKISLSLAKRDKECFGTPKKAVKTYQKVLDKGISE
jgi:hypothetical protein